MERTIFVVFLACISLSSGDECAVPVEERNFMFRVPPLTADACTAAGPDLCYDEDDNEHYRRCYLAEGGICSIPMTLRTPYAASAPLDQFTCEYSSLGCWDATAPSDEEKCYLKSFASDDTCGCTSEVDGFCNVHLNMTDCMFERPAQSCGVGVSTATVICPVDPDTDMTALGFYRKVPCCDNPCDKIGGLSMVDCTCDDVYPNCPE